MQNVHVIEHPLVQHKISLLRDANTGTKEFRELVSETATLMCYEATRDLPLKEVEIKTPRQYTKSKIISGHKIALIPILRGGLPMAEGISQLIPTVKIGHVGAYREPSTGETIKYYAKFPADIEERHAIIVDTMLATGGASCLTATELKNVGIKSIKFMCLIASPEGLEALTTAHPDIEIYCCCIDKGLDENNYIVPGLGDAGDRIFGTK
ncbi:MAG: uracil phosphoribosyltransferase [Oscillospiraceae bacterium]